jgi:hypothetical protein
MMLPVQRVIGSLATTAAAAGLAVIVVSVLGVVQWVAAMIAGFVILAATLVRRRILNR